VPVVPSAAVRFASNVRPLGPNNPAPEFEGNAVVNGEFKPIAKKDYKGKWLVFFFYPMDFTFVCPTEIIAFNDRVDEFRKLSTELVACSCDSQFTHLAWIQTPRKEGGLGDMQIPVLADFNKKIAREFGVLDENIGAAYRGLFLIDPKGNIRHTLVNDLPVGRSVDEALRILKAFQFFEKHGEVCPADWEEDKPSINTKSAKDYFSKVNK
jgi:alkyl hydroperoxide reductase subunit AhpC